MLFSLPLTFIFKNFGVFFFFGFVLVISESAKNVRSILEKEGVRETSAYIEGVRGETLNLPCPVSPSPGDKVALILWYRDHQPDAVFTYDARGIEELERAGPLKGRATFHMTHMPHLSLRRAALSDAGVYECRVDYLKAPSRTNIMKVYVVEPPTNLLIKGNNGQASSFSITEALGGTLTLTCVATGGYPRPRVWWTLNGEVIDDSYEESEEDVIRNELSLPLLERSLHQSQLECHASNTNTTDPLKQSLPLLLNLPPTTVIISALPLELHSGRKYKALCTVYGSRPAPTVTWRLTPVGGESKFLEKEDLRTKNETRTWVEFKIDHTLNGASLSCSAASPALPNVLVANKTSLNVVFAPRLLLALGGPLKSASIKEGIDVYFKCSILANPPVTTIKWFNNNKEVLHNPEGGILVSHDHLVLQKISRKWTGEFTCRASNTIGAASSAPLSIIVQYAPVCKLSKMVMRAALGQKISVPCRVHANPANVTFSWTFSNSVSQEQNMSESNVSWSGMESILMYKPEKSEDYGTLKCLATNFIGRQLRPCKIIIKPAGSPSPPSNCSVSNQTWDSLEITCGLHKETGFLSSSHNEEEDLLREDFYPGDEIHSEKKELLKPNLNDRAEQDSHKVSEISIDADEPKYLLTVRKRIGKKLVYNITGRNPVFTVSGLTPGLDYVITISRFNSHGRSPEITLEALTLRTAENRMREKEHKSDQTLLGIIVGVLGLLIILGVLIILLALRGRSHRAHDCEDVTLRPKSTEEDLCESYHSMEVEKDEREPKLHSEKTLLLSTGETTSDTESRTNDTGDPYQPDLIGIRSAESFRRKCITNIEEKKNESTTETHDFFHKGFSPSSSYMHGQGGYSPSPPPSISPLLRSPAIPSSRETKSSNLRSPPGLMPSSECSSPHSTVGEGLTKRFSSSQKPLLSSMEKQHYVRVEGTSYPERESFL